MLQKRCFSGVEIFSIAFEELIETLKKITQKIKDNHPEVKEVILFGSFSSGEFTPFSDVDVAVIVEDTEKRFTERSDDLIDYFVDIPLDVNLVVYTFEEFSRMLSSGNAFAKEVNKGLRL